MKLSIIGTGGMAKQHALNFKRIDGVDLIAACDVDLARAQAFAEEYGIPEAYANAGDLLAQADIDAVAIVTPDASHAPLSLQAIAAGKHVLCEKPLATSYADAQKMVDAAREAGVVNMVNLSYRNSSAIQVATRWVADGKLGRVRHVEASYLQSWLASTDWGDWKTSPGWLWRLSTAHGSKGVLGDVGVHIIDFACMPVGPVTELSCTLKTMDKAPGNRVGDYPLDANDTMLLHVGFANGAAGVITATRWATGHLNSLRLQIHGERGAIRIDLDRSFELMDFMLLDDNGASTPWQTLYTGKTPTIYERFARAVATGQSDAPDFARGAEIQRVLDAAEQSAAQGRPIPLS